MNSDRPLRLAVVAICLAAALCGLVVAPDARAQDTRPFITWFNPPKAPQPLLAHKGYESAAMRARVGYSIYLPPGYADAGNAARYPVIYWLHSRGGSETADQFPPATVDRVIRDKRVPPLIVVYANGGRQSLYADSPDGKWLAETTVVKELIPHVDATYRTVPTRGGRAVQGMSMGGHGAVKLAAKYPDLFGSVVAFAGSYRTVEQIENDATRGIIYQTMFGGSRDRYLAEHPTPLLRRNVDRIRGRTGVKLYIGTKDSEVLLANNRKLHALLDELGVRHEYTEVDGVEHNLPKLAAAAGSESIEFAARHFRTGE